MLCRKLITRWRKIAGELFRYGGTSVVAASVSAVTFVALYATGLASATATGVAASLAGAVPSYFMSKYWIWPRRESRNWASSYVSFFVLSLLSMMASTWATNFTNSHLPPSPQGSPLRTALLLGAYFLAYGLLWVAKFVIYKFVVFRPNGNGRGAALVNRGAPRTVQLKADGLSSKALS